jgi:hypothetical protein
MDCVGGQQGKLNNQLISSCPQNEQNVLGGKEKS